MKSIDAEAIGRLIDETLSSDMALNCPIADREQGYEEDLLSELEFVAGDYTRLRITTVNGKQFVVTVEQRD